MKISLASFIAIFFLVSCTVLEFEDVSTDPEFKSHLGKRFTTKVELIAHGITMDQNYAKTLSHVSITAFPGFTGPEVLFRSMLPAGSQFEIIKVLRSKWTLLGRKVKCVARPIGFSLPEQSNVWVSCPPYNETNLESNAT